MASEHTAVVLLVAASAGLVAAIVGAAFALNVPSRIGNVIARGSLGLLAATALGVSAALLAVHSTYIPETIDCAPSAHRGEVLVAIMFVLVSALPLWLAFAHRDVEFHARWALIVSGAELALFLIGMAYIATVNPCTGA